MPFSAAGRIGVAAVAIAVADAAVEIVDAQFGALVTAHLPPGAYRLPLRIVMAGGTLAAAALDIPTPGGRRNDVVGFRPLLRHNTLLSYVFVRYIERDRLRLVNDKVVRYTSNKANRFNCNGILLTMPSTLGEKLKELRRKKKYSLDELAKLSGASKSYLWELENRPDRKPSAEKLIDIARVLGTTTDYLVDDNATFDDAQVKEAFFRKFNRLDDETKGRVMDMIDVWSRKK